MTLDATSNLWYWDARYGEIPLLGGEPVHTRASGGVIDDGRGILYNAIINTPRRGWDVINGKRQQTMLMEGSATNYMDYSENMGNWSAGSGGLSRPTGYGDPFANLHAYRIFSSTANDTLYRNFSFVANGQKTVSVFLKKGTSLVYKLALYDTITSTTLQRMRVDWNATTGVPSVTTEAGAGTLTDPEPYNDGWYRFSFTPTASVVAANLHRLYQYVSVGGAGQDTFVFGVQAEHGTHMTSYIWTPAGAAVTRAADQFYWNGRAPDPIGMVLYTKFIDVGSIDMPVASARIVMLENTAAANPKFGIYVPSAGSYAAYHHNNTSSVQAGLAVSVNRGDLVELMAVLYPTGSIRLTASVNGAATTDSGSTSGLAINSIGWSGDAVDVNSAGSTNQGLARFAQIKIAKFSDIISDTAQHMMDQMRDWEIGPSGDLL